MEHYLIFINFLEIIKQEKLFILHKKKVVKLLKNSRMLHWCVYVKNYQPKVGYRMSLHS